MKKIIVSGIVISVILGGWYLFNYQREDVIIKVDNSEKTVGTNPLDATYLIEEEPLTLVNGTIEKEITPGSATLNKVMVFGEPAYGDIDGDGDQDAILILVNERGGSGVFYYAAMAVNINGEYKGTDSILLGDRIAPQTFYIEGNKAVVNYVERKPGEDFSVQPSMGKSLYLQFDPASLRLIWIEPDFAGEADPNIMTLDMQSWTWIKTTYNNGDEILPKSSEAFTLTFTDGNLSATTDCNSMGGQYQVENKQISFGPFMATKMFCENSQEQEFAAQLSEVQSYFFTSKGELIFELKSDSGSMIFR